MATAVLVYLVLSGRQCGDGDGGAHAEDRLISSAVSAAAAAWARRKEEARARRRRRKEQARARWRWPERTPGGWGEAAAVAACTVGAHLRDQVLHAAAALNVLIRKGTDRIGAIDRCTECSSEVKARLGAVAC